MEAQVEQSLEKISTLITGLNELLKNQSQIQSQCQLPVQPQQPPEECYRLMNENWNKLDQIPCMCCEKSSHSFDKSFFSKEEGMDTTGEVSLLEVNNSSQSLFCFDYLDKEEKSIESVIELADNQIDQCSNDNSRRNNKNEMANLNDNGHNRPRKVSIAMPEFVSFNVSESENSLKCNSSLDDNDETSFILSYSEPSLSKTKTDDQYINHKNKNNNNNNQPWLILHQSLTKLQHYLKKDS